MTQPSQYLGNPTPGDGHIPASAMPTAKSGNFLSFFGLRRNPFNVNPDPRDLFWTPQTIRALSELTGAIESGKSLIVLTGEVGTGKTTLINHLLNSLRERELPVAFVFNSHLDIDNLFDFILADFGIKEDLSHPRNVRKTLHDWLYARRRAGHRPVLIVDEAQGLTFPVLEEIRMLLNLEVEGEKLIQIMLAGQPELDFTLAKPQLLQLRQRISLRCHTAALTVAETHDYIHRRLEFGGAQPDAGFAPEALDAIYFYSGGTPRVINLLCEQALMRAHRERILPATAQIVEEVAREFQFDEFKPFPRSVSFAPQAVADILSMPASPTKMRMSAMASRAVQQTATESPAAGAHLFIPNRGLPSMPAPSGILRARELAPAAAIQPILEPPPPQPASPAPQPIPAPAKIIAVEPIVATHWTGAGPAASPKPLLPPTQSIAAPAKTIALEPIVATHRASAAPPAAARIAATPRPAWQQTQRLISATSRWLRQPMRPAQARRG
jgi:general secretion pathway protein A